MRAALEPGGPLAGHFGTADSVALEATRRGEELFLNLSHVLIAEPDTLRSDIRQWAERNPVGDFTTGRISVLEATAGGPAADYRSSAFGVDEMQTTIEDLNARLPLLVENGVDQALWDIELMLAERGIYGAVNSTVDGIEGIDTSVRSVAADVDSVVAALQFLDSLHFVVASERAAVLGDIDRQRRETLSQLSAERLAVLEAIERHLDTVLATLQAERALVLSEVDAITDRKFELASAGLKGIVDHLFWRTLQLLGVVTLLVVAVGVILTRRRKRG